MKAVERLKESMMLLKNRKESLRKFKNPKVLVPLLLIIIIIVPLISYFLGNLMSSRYPNWSKAFNNIAIYSSFGLLREKEVIMTEKKDESKVNLVTVLPSEVEISNKRVSIYNGESETTYMFSALLKNNSKYGIPRIIVKSIKIYDKGNNLIGEKTDYLPGAPLIVVKEGEYPFSFSVIKEDKNWDPEYFDLEIEIPQFAVNESAVRLDITNLELIDRMDCISIWEEDYGCLPQEFRYVNYTYDVTIKNNTSKTVEGIYYISFLKYQDFVLSSLEDSCCTEVLFSKDSDPISLNVVETFSELQPGQEETIRIKMRPYDFLYVKGMNEEEVEFVPYVIGLAQ